MSLKASWPWASRPRSSPPSRCRGSTHRRSRSYATAAGECSWLDSKRRSATRMGDLFHYEFMVHAFEAGTIISIVAGAIGYFVVLRGTAFAAHALSHIGFAGATGAVVLSLNPIIGLLAFTLGAGVTIGALGSRLRERDVTIGIVLAWTLGLGVLFISLYRGYATEAYAILFGEILGISTTDVTVTLVAGLITLAAIIALYRPLLFSSVDEDLAAAKGVPVTALSIAFMAILAVAGTEAVQVVGVLLTFAPLAPPAVVAVRFTCRPPVAILAGIGLAVAFTWVGLTVSYYSPHPVSFFITSLAFATYLAVRMSEPIRDRLRRAAG